MTRFHLQLFHLHIMLPHNFTSIHSKRQTTHNQQTQKPNTTLVTPCHPHLLHSSHTHPTLYNPISLMVSVSPHRTSFLTHTHTLRMRRVHRVTGTDAAPSTLHTHSHSSRATTNIAPLRVRVLFYTRILV